MFRLWPCAWPSAFGQCRINWLPSPTGRFLLVRTSYRGYIMAAFKKLEMFDGTGDVERFIDRFEFAVAVDGLSKEKIPSYLAMHLSGPAFDVFKGMKDGTKEDAEEIKKVLRNTYGIRRSAAWRTLTTFRINTGQQLDSACEELHKLSKIVTFGKDPASTLAAVAFVEALPGPVAQRVRVLCGQFATKEQVVEAAKDIWEASDNEVTAAVNSSQRRGQARSAFNGEARRGPSSGASKAEMRRCYGCGLVGHLRRNCNAVCTKCGRSRHSERFCHSAGNESGEQ